MAYGFKKKANIRADYEAGKLSQRKVAHKWGISRNTLKKFADEEGWGEGRNYLEMNHKLTQSTTQKIVQPAIGRREADKLLEYSDEFIKNIKILDMAHKAHLRSYIVELKATDGKLSKEDGYRYKSIQQFLKLSAETFRINFESMRLAMGIRSPDAPTMNLAISLEHMKDFDKLSDLELSNILATDKVHAPITINELGANA